MAKNTIKVDVVVDDKGTLKQVGNKAKQAAGGLDNVGTSAGTADRNIKGTAQASANATKNFSKMSQGMGGLVGVYATVAANVFALSAAFNFLKDAADLKVLEQGQIAYSASTGIAMKSLTNDIVAATNAQISFRDAAQSAAIGLASGLTQTQLKEIGTAARDVSIVLGRDVTDSFNRLVRGITKAEPELLDELGVVLRLETATKKYAAALGKNVKELTAFERSQAVALDTLGQVEEKYSVMLTDQQKLGNSIVKLGKAFEENLINPVKKGVIGALIPTIEFLSKNLLGLAGILTLLALPITKAIIPSMDQWAKNSKKSAEQARAAYASVKKEIKELEIAQQKIKQSADPGAAAQQALAGVKSKSTGIAKLQAGNSGALSPRELSSLLVAAEKGTGAVTKMSKDMQIQYIAALRAMKAQSETTAGAIQRRFKLMGQSLKIQFKGIEAAWKLTMAALQSAATKAAKGIDLVFKAMSWIGWILLGIDLAKAAYRKFFEWTETQAEKAARAARAAEEEANEVRETKYKSLNSELEQMAKNAKELQGLARSQAIGNVAGNIDLIEFSAALNENSEEAIKTVKLLRSNIRALGGDVSNMPNIIEDTFKIGGSEYINVEGIEGFLSFISMLQEAGQHSGNLRQNLKDIVDIENNLVNSKKQTTEFDGLIGKIQENILLSRKEGVTLSEDELQSLAEQEAKLGTLVEARKTALGISKNLENSEINLAIALRSASEEGSKLLQSKYEEEKIASKINEHIQQNTLYTKLNIDLGDDLIAKRGRELLLLREQLGVQNDKTRAAQAELDAVATKNALEQRTANVGLREKRAEGIPTLFKEQEGRAIAVQKEQIALERVQETYRQQEETLGRIIDKESTLYKETQDQMALTQVGIETQTEALDQAKRNLSDVGRIGLEVGNTLTNSMASAFDGLIQGTMTAKEAFASMATSILQNVAKMIAEMITLKLIQTSLGAMGGFGTSLGGFLGIPTGRYGGVMTPEPYRYGGVSKAEGYSMGGIARGKDAGYPAILHGTEAVVPLPNNRSIPVDLKGAGQNNSVVVNVSIDQQGNATQDKQASSNQAGNMGAAIAAAVQKELQNQKRSGGILNPYGAA